MKQKSVIYCFNTHFYSGQIRFSKHFTYICTQVIINNNDNDIRTLFHELHNTRGKALTIHGLLWGLQPDETGESV